METREVYRRLNLEPVRTYSPEEIRAAFKRACLSAHPDKGGSNQELYDLREAYAKAQTVLTDPQGLDRDFPVIEVDVLASDALDKRTVHLTSRVARRVTCSACGAVLGQRGCWTCWSQPSQEYFPIVRFDGREFRPGQPYHLVDDLDRPKQYRAKVNLLFDGSARLDSRGDLIVGQTVWIDLSEFMTKTRTKIGIPGLSFLGEISIPLPDLSEFNDQVSLRLKNSGFPKDGGERTDLLLTDVRVKLPTTQELFEFLKRGTPT
jgi:hypothetical protein